jgi:hypothetical protein
MAPIVIVGHLLARDLLGGDDEVALVLAVEVVRHQHHAAACSEKGVRLAQNMQVGPCIAVGTQL